MTNAGILIQFKKIVDHREYEGLRQRAYGRAIADYIIGMNGTQSLTLQCGGSDLLTTGRVQTPVLKMIIDRYNDNKKHKKVISYAVDLHFKDYVLKNNTLRFTNEEESKIYTLSGEIKQRLKGQLREKNHLNYMILLTSKSGRIIN